MTRFVTDPAASLSTLSGARGARIGAATLLIAALLPSALTAQGAVTVAAGTATRALVAPATRFAVPIVVDLSAAPGASLASLSTDIAWGAGRLALDSIRGTGFGTLTTNAAADRASIALFSTSGVTTSTAVATMYFTAAATSGGTQVVPRPIRAGSETGASLTALLRARPYDVCIAPIGRLGDVTGDSVVNIIDAQQIARYAVGLPVANPSALSAMGDVTGDNSVDILDAQQIARNSIGLPVSATIGVPAPLIAPVAALTVPLPVAPIYVGGVIQLSPVPTDTQGVSLVGCVPVTWASSNASIASVSPSGVLTPIAPGVVTITASAAGRSGSVSLTSVVPLGGVALAPDTATLHMGDTLRLAPTVRDANGLVLTGQAITFSSSDTSVATVASDGLVTTRTVGSVTITGIAAGSMRSGATQLQVAPLAVNALAVAGGHSCVLTVAGLPYCWGSNTSGQLGDGTFTNASTPVRVAATPGLRFTNLSASDATTCAIATTQLVYCWGSVGMRGTFPTPALVSSTLRARSISVGNGYGCALDLAGAAFCWGRNPSGILGTGDTVSVTLPAPVTGGHVFKSIGATLSATCALDSGGTVYCWGSNGLSTLGLASNPSRLLVPTPVDGGLIFGSLGAGAVGVCGTVASGAAYCWGTNYFGSLGQGTTASATVRPPTAVTGGIVFATVLPGNGNNVYDVNCGLAPDGTAYCWGNNKSGQLGTTAVLPGSCTFQTATFACTGTPTAVTTTEKFVVLGPANQHVCGITTTRLVLCWGGNSAGEVGDGTLIDRATPVGITGGLRIP